MGDYFSLTSVIDQQSVTVTDSGTSNDVSGVTSSLGLSSTTAYGGAGALSQAQRAIFTTAYQETVHGLGCVGLGYGVAGAGLRAPTISFRNRSRVVAHLIHQLLLSWQATIYQRKSPPQSGHPEPRVLRGRKRRIGGELREGGYHMQRWQSGL